MAKRNIIYTKEMKMVSFNLEKLKIKHKPEMLDLIENVYFERIKEQKKENIVYRFINVVLGVLLLIFLLIAYSFTVKWAFFLLLNLFYTSTQVLNYIKLRKDLKSYKNEYANRLL